MRVGVRNGRFGSSLTRSMVDTGGAGAPRAAHERWRGTQLVTNRMAADAPADRVPAPTEADPRLGEDAVYGLWILDAHGGTIEADPRLADMLGYSAEEAQHLCLLRSVFEDDRAAAAEFLAPHAPRPERHALRLRRKDGSAVWAEISVLPRLDSTGAHVGALLTVRDLGDRHRAVDRLAASEERFRSLVACADDTIVMTDLAGHILFINDAGRRLYGSLDPNALIGQSAFDLLTAESRTAAQEGLRLVLEQGVARHRDYVLVRRDGTRVPVEMTVSLMRDAAGAPCGFMSITRDVGERRRAEARTAALLDVASALSGTLEVWEILDRVQPRTAAVLGCDAVVTFGWDPTLAAFRALGIHVRDPATTLDLHALEFRRGVPFVDRLTSLRTVVINDGATQPWVPAELLAANGISALVWTQLVVRNRPIGALVALSTDSGFVFDAGQVSLLEGIAQQLAIALDTAELYQAQRREAEAAAALARVSREMMIALDGGSELLERLCRLTTDVLACEGSHTLLWDRAADVYALVAAHGYSEPQRERLRQLAIPRAALLPTLARLGAEEAIGIMLPAMADDPLAGLARDLGANALLCMGLRDSTEVVGVHVAAGQAPRLRFDARNAQVARGIARIASLTLRYRRLLQQLQGDNQMKSDFVATLSHELRSPLNVVIGYADLLLDRAFGDLTAEQTEVIARIDRTVSMLLELIDTTLDMSRFEDGRVVMELSDVALSELLAALDAETRELRATRPDVQFVWQVAPDVPLLRTDAVKLKVVLRNLIANAFKFTAAGRVRVEARRQGTGATIRVADTGHGIPPEALPVIFEAFRQAPGTARHLGGVGLGLYIVRRLLEMLGGTVQVDSVVGKGSAFAIWLPLHYGGAAGSAARPAPDNPPRSSGDTP
jgi:PAS domain S-box-containing protein